MTLDKGKIDLWLGRNKMTRRSLCEKSGFTEANLSTILKRGRVRPKTAGILADALGVDVVEILMDPEGEAYHEERR